MTGQLLLFVPMSLFSHGDKILLYRTQQEMLKHDRSITPFRPNVFIFTR